MRAAPLTCAHVGAVARSPRSSRVPTLPGFLPLRAPLTRANALAHARRSLLPRTPKMEVYRPRKAYPVELAQFHSEDYVDFLARVTPDNQAEYLKQMQQFNLGEDCPIFDGLFEFCKYVANALPSAWRATRLGARVAGVPAQNARVDQHMRMRAKSNGHVLALLWPR